MTPEHYFRPLVQTDRARPENAVAIGGGPCWFTKAELLRRDAPPRIVSVGDISPEILDAITRPRAKIAGLPTARPLLMGILNVTPDSFSDGGRFDDQLSAENQAATMVAQGADIIDIGGESTRPGADPVTAEQERARCIPVIKAVRAASPTIPISIDTRKSDVARAALDAGAAIINDVSALTYDDKMLDLLKKNQTPVCLMHAGGDPKTMQDSPKYEDVLLDVYDFLAARIAHCAANGIDLDRIIVDPGIGFGKTLAHNLALIRGLSLFHGLGCRVLLGVSRKAMIGQISGEKTPDQRVAGSIALGLEAVRQGVQILRVHDVGLTKQALQLWAESR